MQEKENNNTDKKVYKISVEELRKQAIAYHKKDDFQRAIQGYKAYLKARPKDVGIWTNLGAALRKQKHYQSAVNCYRRALELNPDDIAVLGNLANALKDLQRMDEAIALHQRVIQQQPENIQSLMNYASALREAGQFSDALEQLNKAQSIEPNNPGIEWERSQNLLYLGDYTAGWQAYEARWQTGNLPVKNFSFPQWQGEPLEGKTILLHSEQGYGDTILAARFVPQIKSLGATVILQCKKELHRLFEYIGADHLVEGDHSVDSANNILDNAAIKDLMIDYHCPLMSLMAVLNIQPQAVPEPAALHIPEASKEKFQFINQQHSDCLKVGIVWSGSITFANNDNRSVTIDQFLSLAEIPGIRLYSLQKGPRAKELYAVNADSAIEDIGRLCEDFADTAAVIDQLDVIVMTDSSVAHLAASLGKPVINLLQAVPYWLYMLQEEKTPWYPSMQLIKQQQAGQWREVFEQAEKKLRSWS